MLDKLPVFYEFGKVRYCPQRRLVTSLDGKKERRLTPQSQDFLTVLLGGGHTGVTTHAELWAEVWPDDKRSLAEPEEREAIKRSIAEAKKNLVKLLCEVGGKADMIEPVRGKGYRLAVSVNRRYTGEADKSKKAVTAQPNAQVVAPVNAPQITLAPAVPETRPETAPQLAETQTVPEPELNQTVVADAPVPLVTEAAAAKLNLMMVASLSHGAGPSDVVPHDSATVDTLAQSSSAVLTDMVASPADAAAPVRLANVKGYVLAMSSLFATLFAIALLLEIAYAWDSYGASALRLAPLVWLWMAGATVGSMQVAARVKRHGLLLAFLLLVVAEACLTAVLSFFLPSVAITESRLQAQTAFGAYFKNAFLYFLPLGLFLLLIPSHCLATLWRNLQLGQQSEIRQMLEHGGPAPVGVIYLKPWWLVAILGSMALLSLGLTFQLLNNLWPGTYYNLFTLLVFARLLAYFITGGLGLLWYEAQVRQLRWQLALTQG